MIIAVCISKCVFMPMVDVCACRSFALYPTVLPFITSHVILIRSVSLKRWKREWQTGQMRVAHLSVTVRSSLRPPVPSFHAPIYFPSTHISEFSLTHSHTCKQAFTHLYMQISGGCCFSKVKKQHHLSVSEYVFRFTCFFLASVICYAYFSNYYLPSAMCCAFEAVLGLLGSSPYKRSWASRQDLKIQ